MAGTFGSSLEGGGGNNVMAAFLVMVLAFLGALWQEQRLATQRWLVLSFFVMLPLFMGEVKISVVYLLLLFLVLGYRHFAKSWLQAVLAALGALVVIVSLVTVIAIFFSKGKSPDEFVEKVVAYNFGETGMANYELNRTSVFVFWWQEHGLSNVVQTLIGHGIGSSFAAGQGLVSGRMHEQYPTKGIGLTAASQLLWDLGIVGVLLFAVMFIAAWQTAGVVEKRTENPDVRAGMRASRVALMILALWYPYKATIMISPAAQVVFAAVFGYIAYCWQSIPQPKQR